MNEDIKILEDTVREHNLTAYQTLKNVLNRCKELEENKKLKETDLTQVYLKGVYDERAKNTSFIEEKIEELKLSGGSNGTDVVENLARELVVEILQEILEGRK